VVEHLEAALRHRVLDRVVERGGGVEQQQRHAEHDRAGQLPAVAVDRARVISTAPAARATAAPSPWVSALAISSRSDVASWLESGAGEGATGMARTL
jgi:hypothetical protein